MARFMRKQSSDQDFTSPLKAVESLKLQFNYDRDRQFVKTDWQCLTKESTKMLASQNPIPLSLPQSSWSPEGGSTKQHQMGLHLIGPHD